MFRIKGFCIVLLAYSSAGSITNAYARADNVEKIRINDMRKPAGKLANGVLLVTLEARNGAWYPEGDDGKPRYVAAFGEAGKRLQNPGPLIRVPVGTEVRIRLRNTLADSLWIFGLGEKRGLAGDSFAIAAGATRDVQFTATEAGVFWYAGKTNKVPLFGRGGSDSQLNGAIVVDPAGARPDDRIFLISWWFTVDSSAVSGLGEGTVLAMNGKSWPHTERMHVTQGEEQRWRFVSLTNVPHPMHLHGFYFRVDGVGDGKSFKELPAGEREMAVTQTVPRGTSLAITWVPQKPGNWIMHCHIAGHMTSLAGLNKDRRYRKHTHGMQEKSSHDQHLMGGLVVGITVKPKGAMKASTGVERPIRLVIKSRANVFGEYAGYSYVLGGSAEENDPAAMPLNGPTLVLQKDQPVAVTIVNRSHDPAAVHWHGIELESFPDGVPGISGYGKNLLPSIAPDDSFTVRFTPPRAGTFMYHSHSNELQQIGSGLVGALVVVEPGQKLDPETDRVLLFADGGPIVNLITGPFPPLMLNGSLTPRPIELKAGTRYRFRVISIRAEFPMHMTLLDGDKTVQWKRLARDGADLPESQRKVVAVDHVAEPGEIADFEFTPTQTGQLTLRFGYPPSFKAPRFPEPKSVVVNVR